MYIEDWDSFYVQAEELWRKDPIKTRYCIKYSHTKGELVLKVTDDVVVSAFRRLLRLLSSWRRQIKTCHPPPPPTVPEIPYGSIGGRQAHGEAEQAHVCDDVSWPQRIAGCASPACAAAASPLPLHCNQQPGAYGLVRLHTPARCR